MGSSGKGLGIFALILAIGALGVGLYPIIFPTPSIIDGSKIYGATNENKVYLNSNTYEIIPNLNLTYTAKAGNSVSLEFSCQLSVEIISPSTRVDFKFEIDGLPPSPDTEISVIALAPDVYWHIPFMMRHYIESSSEGTHVVKVLTKIDDIITTSYVEYCVLTATVY